MSYSQRNGISTPAAGLLVYQTDDAAGFYYFDGSDWVAVSSGSNSTTNAIGDFAHGGIVFWVDDTGEHGLVCAKSDQSSGLRWHAGGYCNTRVYGDGPFAGEMNTLNIIMAHMILSDDGGNFAARLCADTEITEGGKSYGDWYLPSKEELGLMWQNKTTIDATAIGNGGSAFACDHYWSSTEYSYYEVWTYHFCGTLEYNVKPMPLKVRAVRAF
jgi:hypothetical protein